MTDAAGDIALEFPINQELLEEATQAREEWRVIRDRLAKVDGSRGQVSGVVYERVRKDYEARLREVTALLMRKKEAVDRELSTLRETRKKILAQLEDHRHKLEEIKFRNTLGEFTEEEYQSAARTEQDKIAKFETIINAVDNNIGRYESIFAGEEELFALPEAAAEEEVSGIAEVSGITPAAHETEPRTGRFGAEPVTDAKGFVIEEEAGPDYFGATTEPEGTRPEIEESATSKGPPGIGAPKAAPAPKRRARIVVISGDEAGAAYTIKGTATFGRAETNTVVLRDAKVSRQHSQIQQQGNEYVLIDLNSSNGTFVNGQRIEEHVLSNGDEIMIGDFILQFQA